MSAAELIESLPKLETEDHTTSGRRAGYEIDLEVRGLKPGVFNVQALQPVSCHRFERRIADLSPEQMESLNGVIRRWLSL